MRLATDSPRPKPLVEREESPREKGLRSSEVGSGRGVPVSATLARATVPLRSSETATVVPHGLCLTALATRLEKMRASCVGSARMGQGRSGTSATTSTPSRSASA